jgi:hypothetical protein
MKIIGNTLLTISLCIIMTMPAHAGRYHDDNHLTDRMHRQHERIERGVESGALNREEARKLKKQQRKIHSKAREFREDGVLSKKERRILNKQLDKGSNRIRAFKHNDGDRHTDGYASREIYRDTRWHHRHHERDEHYEADAGAVYWVSDSDVWSRFGFIFW